MLGRYKRMWNSYSYRTHNESMDEKGYIYAFLPVKPWYKTLWAIIVSDWWLLRMKLANRIYPFFDE